VAEPAPASLIRRPASLPPAPDLDEDADGDASGPRAGADTGRGSGAFDAPAAGSIRTEAAADEHARTSRQKAARLRRDGGRLFRVPHMQGGDGLDKKNSIGTEWVDPARMPDAKGGWQRVVDRGWKGEEYLKNPVSNNEQNEMQKTPAVDHMISFR
jgi:hypothetical protein